MNYWRSKTELKQAVGNLLITDNSHTRPEKRATKRSLVPTKMQIDLFPINSTKTQQRACSITELSCGFAQPIHVY